MSEEAITAQDELHEVADLYREADVQEKEAKSVKDGARPALLDLMSEVVRDEVTLLERTETVEDVDDEFDVQLWAKRNFPTWNVVGVQPTAGGFVVTLQESDQFKKYEFVHEGFKFGRTVRMKDAGFEVEEFRDYVASSDLEEEVKESLLGTITEKTVVVYSFNEKKANKLMGENKEFVPIFQKFVNPGRPEISLLPIQAVKESDEV